jgi:hypothetical protein
LILDRRRLKILNLARGVPGDKRKRCNIVHDYRLCRNDGAIANSDTGKYGSTGTNPDVVPDTYRLDLSSCLRLPLKAASGIECVPGSVEHVDVRCDEAIRSN